ncbi:MAG: alpha/beta fold hydrolase [Candidatus Aminicenantes bacterium]|nr:alpha/beta fold hydrolase [Candidatus Aminicenantes bacterium]
MQDSIFQLEGKGEYMFFRHNKIKPGKTTLLFVHGLGESGLCFKEVFQYPEFDKYNVMIPDLVGYGRSSAAANGDYSYKSQVRKLQRLILDKSNGYVIVIGHSLGGDLCTQLCAEDKGSRIKAFVNIEGDLTQAEMFISGQADEAEKDGDFERWFKEDFMLWQVLKDGGKRYDSCRRYYASLQFCRPKAFLENAQELVEQNTKLKGEFESEIGETYCTLPIKKIFCYGKESIKSDSLTLKFIEKNGLKSKKFPGAFHWIMIDRADMFYPFLHEFASEV